MQQNTYLQDIHIKSDNQINYLAGGINTVYPPQNIQDDECQDMENLCLDKYPAIRTRMGRTLKANPGLLGDDVTYFGVAGIKYLFYVQGGVLKDADGAEIASDIPTTKLSHVYYADGNNEYLILYGKGVTPTRHRLPLSRYNTPEIMTLYGTMITVVNSQTNEEEEVEATQTLPQGVTYFEHMCYHKNRMIASIGNMLYFSALQNPMDWRSTENSREDRVPNCNQITGLVSFDDKLIVFSEENMHLYYGSNVISGNYDTYTCISLDNNIGCYDQRTIKVHNSLLYWIYGRNIYEYDGSTIRNIEKPTSNNGVTGGIRDLIYGINLDEAKNVSVAASEDKIYFYFPDKWYPEKFQIIPQNGIDIIVGSGLSSQEEEEEIISVETSIPPCLLIFDQRLRKWTKELECEANEDELHYISICDAYTDLHYSKIPSPIYALTNNGVIYELTGGRRSETEYARTYGKDEYVDDEGDMQTVNIPFYIKTKEFKNGVLSKRKSLSELWFNYDLDGIVNIKIITDSGKTITKENVLPNGTNKTECVLVPNDMQNVNSYTFEIYGEGDFTLYAMERKDRTHSR